MGVIIIRTANGVWLRLKFAVEMMLMRGDTEALYLAGSSRLQSVHTKSIFHQAFFLELLKTSRIGLLQKQVGWQVKCARFRLNRLLKTDGEWIRSMIPYSRQPSKHSCRDPHVTCTRVENTPSEAHAWHIYFVFLWMGEDLNKWVGRLQWRKAYSSPFGKEKFVSRCSLLNIQGNILSTGALHDTYHFTK